MKTERIQIQEAELNSERGKTIIERAGNVIREGGLVAFPTETVYGLGGDALRSDSSKKIYAAKNRPSDNPLIVHIAEKDKLNDIVREIPEKAHSLIEAFWPGPLTLIFYKSETVPSETTGGLDTVAVRMPSDRIALSFIQASGGYIAAPSANASGRPSPTLAEYVEEDMAGRIEMILDGGQACVGLESTILDLTVNPPMILRPGAITEEMLRAVIGAVDTDSTVYSDGEGKAPKAPGMKYRHYAPKARLIIVSGESEKVICAINEKTKKAMMEGKKVGIIATEETKEKYVGSVIKSVGRRSREETIAKELYHVLREFDVDGVDVIYSEAFDNEGIGRAVMNRLLKAAGHHVEFV